MMFDKIRSDLRAALEMDPAATGTLEVIFTYPGFHAILSYRVAHWFYRMGLTFFARVISQISRFLTGIEIHPAAKIGGSFFIDHGMGVVIGETTEIGEHVLLFQGVTLGGTGKERGKRHPTVGNYVVVGTGAKVLGAITIGDRVKVGANAVVLQSVPPHSTVVGVPGRVVRLHGERPSDSMMLDHMHMPDPMNEALNKLQKQLTKLEQRLDPTQAGGSQKPQPQQQPASGKKERNRQKGGSPRAVADELPVETVQERQARMARMEKEERMKAIAMKRQRDAALAAEQAEERPEGEAAAAKKKVRRRRRKKPGEGGGSAAPEGGDASAGSQSGEREQSEAPAVMTAAGTE